MNIVNSKHKTEFSEKLNQQSENSIWPKITNIISTHTSMSRLLVVAATLRFQISLVSLIARNPAKV